MKSGNPGVRGRQFWTAVLVGQVLLVLAAPGLGQPFGEEGDLDPGVPTPGSVLGYSLGQEWTEHHKLIDYLRTLAGASDRVLLDSYGETSEGRPLVLLTISDPQNLGDLESLKSSYARLADPRRTSESEARSLSRKLPTAVWLSFNIHGDEASSSEAAMGVAYRLAASRDPEILEILKNTVVLLDPCLNPDGRDRFVSWTRGAMGKQANPRPSAREHHQPWPGGRVNHYLFDLNRDWAWLTQQESIARAKTYLSWRPQVHVDFHEMRFGSTYFFFPPVRPIHSLLPSATLKWGTIFGQENAEAFDRRGWSYYTEESFDLLYPGYGDTWPSFQGAVGMTYEQGGTVGLAIERAPGDTLTLRDRAHHHYTSALTTVRTASKNRETRLMDFYRFFTIPENRDTEAYFFPPGGDPVLTTDLIGLLMAHGIEVHRAETALSPRGLHHFDGSPDIESLPPGTFVVPVAQPLHRLLKALLEPEPDIPDTFFYDVSAWSLPFSYGIDAYWSEGTVGGKTAKLDRPPRVTGEVVNRTAGYAFVISWETNGAPRAAARLLEQGVRVHFMAREFSFGPDTFPPGSLIIFRNQNQDRLPALLEEVATITGIRVIGVDSGLTSRGPDLGSNHVRLLQEPSVAVLADEPGSPTSVGACWYLLDQSYEIPYSLIRLSGLTESVLENYTVLVFPDDGAGGKRYASRIDSSVVEALKAWVKRGGIFVGLGGGAFFASAGVSGLSTVAQVADPEADLTDDEKQERDTVHRLETGRERESRNRKDNLPGTIFRIKVDPQHPLGFGYRGETRVLKRSNRALELGPVGTNAAWFPPDPRVSGYVSRENAERLTDLPFIVDERVGRGHVVMYVEDPNFRMFWHGLNRIFLNSIFFLNSMNAD